MSLYHLFHGQAIPGLWVPAKVCENRHCEYNNLISLLTVAVILRNIIICYTFQSAFAWILSAILPSFSVLNICLAASGLSCSIWELHCIMQDLSLWYMGSLVLVHGLSCPMICGILVPQPGLKPTCPALQGGFLTSGPPGKSPHYLHYSCHSK